MTFRFSGTHLIFSLNKENLQSSNVNMKARELVEGLSDANNHFHAMPSAANGFHSGFGPSAKPPANNNVSVRYVHLRLYTNELNIPL